MPEGNLTEVTDARGYPSGHHEIVTMWLLEHQPHPLDVLLRVPPVADGVEVAEVELFLQAELDPRHCTGDLAGHERLATSRRLVVEQDAIGCVHPVGLAVVDDGPVGVDLRHAVGRS